MSQIGITKNMTMADGTTISIETGKLAKQADGSVVVRQGNTMLLATVVSSKEAKDNVDFMPLSVDYREMYASTGKFPGGFFKREARPSEHEILISRLIDRALRPLFPDDYHAETQVQVFLISSDKTVMPDSLAALAASAALAVSDIPFHGPISEVRVAKIDGEYVVNPMFDQVENATMDLMVAATMDNIMMVEGEMKEVSEAEMLEAMKIAHDAIKIHCQGQIELAGEIEKAQTKREYCHETSDEDLAKDIEEKLYDKVYAVAAKASAKHDRSAAFKAIIDEYKETLSEEILEENGPLIGKYYHDVEKKAIRRFMLDERSRLDGRNLDEIRPIWCEVDYLPMTHGSAIFTRGETQSLVTVTLGNKMDEQMIDGAILDGKNNFLLHYNFPSFSVGEARFKGGTSRREVGHGNLALRALKHVIPPKAEVPYTIRIVSDILESNGSSSMATVCGGTLALMDAGVAIPKPVSGIAMGLISDTETDKYAILSDILGDEDHLGDMDFKVTGTRDGITACQMDIKVDGLSYQILEEALEQARVGRLHILGEMEKTISEPREDYKPHVPRIEKIFIPKEFIGAVIGPGGKIIQEIQAETKTVIVLEEVGDQGVIDISSSDKASIDAAIAWIKGITAQPEEGETYEGKIKSITSFGAFVEIMPGKEGLLHISEINYDRVENVEDVLSAGDMIKVKLLEVNNVTGKLKLSAKALLPKPEGYVERPPRQDRDRKSNDRGRGNGGGRDRDSRDRDRGSRDRRR
ncbi:MULTISPECIES: polyribonucleotide nucleotidyltransferase [unclassified Lentimicrobium]|uniref:polyribonucleotide nucleotidyltransferase n=1 Tax=unclassified Lentimicrobium TaxID=2677434 RepID=UPI001556E5FF|nr:MULTISPECIES: polyribonucleotide nucleotidyltransferase [unclassified Lentimicrobium]NPD45929.1 polyribonucleotide nucleotidyltransferase [Lentimicrobium sp. S6]NPD85938.1 polyribonucleotide nucleotidyltransferase [Lentimicrobium sp. L6]